MRSSISAPSRRSTSVPPTSWAISSVSHTASAVGSARCALNTASVRSKSVEISHSRSAASKAGRMSSGARRPTRNSACGIERPRLTDWMRISSISRGQASRAWSSRRARRARADAIGNQAAPRPMANGAITPVNSAHPIAAPTRNSTAGDGDELADADPFEAGLDEEVLQPVAGAAGAGPGGRAEPAPPEGHRRVEQEHPVADGQGEQEGDDTGDITPPPGRRTGPCRVPSRPRAGRAGRGRPPPAGGACGRAGCRSRSARRRPSGGGRPW